MGTARFSKAAWALLGYTLLVIVWGAFVRASGSGDGCGNHWPDCWGAIVPDAQHAKTWIEYAHRVSTGVFLPYVLVLLIAAFRLFEKGSAVRKAASATALFSITEALIGMVLVKKGLVATDASVHRAIWMSLHLINTFLLLSSITAMAHWATGARPARFRGQGSVGVAYLVSTLGCLVLGVSGAISALGDTLFKAESLAHAMSREFSTTAHFLERLRPFHPLIGIGVGLLIIFTSSLAQHLRPDPDAKRIHQGLVALFLIQIGLGVINVLLLAPVWMQLVHLLVADLVWILLMLSAMRALAVDAPRAEVPQPNEPPAAEGARSFRVLVSEYIALTKPRVISLLLFTTLTAMFAAAGGWPGLGLLLAVAVGGYCAAGAANAINMVIDRDIDGTMKRTSKRPTVTQHISSRNALIFAFVLEAVSFGLLSWSANLLSALIALAGLAFYVIVYTLMLKRRTWHNIVIGGAAGAFPPLVGWSAVTGEISVLAWYLFAIIFMWTPVHFWALALLIKEDYAKAGVPMLPVVHGERVTCIQIGLYAVLTTIVSLLPILQPSIGWTYFGAALLLNFVLLVRSLRLYQRPERPQAVSLYKYSMVYLALLFLVFAIDRAVWM